MSHVAGGVKLYTPDFNISVDNTLNGRLGALFFLTHAPASDACVSCHAMYALIGISCASYVLVLALTSVQKKKCGAFLFFFTDVVLAQKMPDIKIMLFGRSATRTHIDVDM